MMGKNNTYPISIVIPIYNEAENIQRLFGEIRKAIAQPYEVIFVDDASKDDSLKILTELSLHYKEIRVIEHKGNYGQSMSLITGIKSARYDWIATMDGDCQNDPADLATFIDTLEQYCNNHHQIPAIIGIRQKRNDPWIRRFSSRFANKIRKSILKDDCIDSSCGLKLFPRDTFLTLPHFNHIHRFLPAFFRKLKLHVIQLPVHHRPRTHGKSKYGINNRLWTGVLDLFGAMWLLHRLCDPEVKNE
jgi:glycosyltransferase involved in cell wall biosynthesis